MNTLNRLTATLALAGLHSLTLLSATLPAQALAQPARSTVQASANTPASNMPRITGFDVGAIDRVEPGAELSFTLWGTPGARASLQIAGATRPLALDETAPGVYQGLYTISRRDRIAPDAEVVGNLRLGNRVGTAVLDEPLQRNLAQAQTPMRADTPQIARFAVTEGGNVRSGVVLYLQAEGTPGAMVSARIPGASGGRVLMHEDRPGFYRGEYRIQPGDRLNPQAPIDLRLRSGDRTVSTTLDRWHTGNLPLSAQNQPNPLASCPDCGTVLSIQRMEVEGEAGVVGSVAGGVLGAVVGSQFGGGRGRTAAGIAGAVGGALIGREVEKNARKREVFEVVLRMRDGQQQSLTLDQAPTVQVGDRVRVVDGALQALGA